MSAENTRNPPPILLSPASVWDRVDPLAPDLNVDPGQDGLSGLPYFRLLGPRFERLPYELLISEGKIRVFLDVAARRI